MAVLLLSVFCGSLGVARTTISDRLNYVLETIDINLFKSTTLIMKFFFRDWLHFIQEMRKH